MSEEMRKSEEEFTRAKAAKQSVREELKRDLARLDEVVDGMRQKVDSLPDSAQAERLKRRWPWWDK